MTGRLFVFGLGFSGLEIAKLAKAGGWTIAGTCTGAEKVARLRADGIEAHLFDGTAALPAAALAGCTHILCTIAPGSAGDPVLRTCIPLLGAAHWLGYLSTTGVYGDRGGDWVDESVSPAPGQPRSIERLTAERAWQELSTMAGVALDIFRLPGIYGPGRSAIDQVRAGKARRIDRPGQYFSRIHVTDIANAVLAAITQDKPGTIYNVADDLPAPSAEVTEFACKLLGLPAPPLIPWDQAEAAMSPMARSFYAESRRVRNDKMKRELGIVLRYPTYREGLRAIAVAN